MNWDAKAFAQLLNSVGFHFASWKCLKASMTFSVALLLKVWGFFSPSILWPLHAACGILVPRSGREPMPLAVEARCLNFWTTSKVSQMWGFWWWGGGDLYCIYKGTYPNRKGQGTFIFKRPCFFQLHILILFSYYNDTLSGKGDYTVNLVIATLSIE